MVRLIQIFKQIIIVSCIGLLLACQKPVLFACEDPRDLKVELYAIDMRYACEGPHYRIIAFHGLAGSQKSEVWDHIMATEHNDDPELSATIDRIFKQEEAGADILIGRDVAFVFTDPKLEEQFNAEIGPHTICDRYHVMGYFKDRSNFVVESFTLIPRITSCFA